MNLLIENLNSAILNNVSVNVIKTLNGEFSKTDLEGQLINLYYDKAIIDITAIKGYVDFTSLFDFLSFFDKNKVILLLNNSELVNSQNYLSKLVEAGYYNFTRNVQGINYLVEHPNELKDVEKYIVPSTFVNPLNTNNTQVNNMEFSAPVNNIGTINNVNPVYNESSNMQNTPVNNEYKKNSNQIIIGIQNLTDHAGSTTLMYMILKQLRINYKVQAIEMMSQDHLYFRDPDIISSTSIEDVEMKIKSLTAKDVIVIDLNDVDGTKFCDHILYLIEPGITKFSKLIKSNRNLTNYLNNGKIILNRSTLKDEEISNFEYETKIKVFFNLNNFNERKDRVQSVDKLLIKLGFKKQQENNGLFGIFK